MVKKLVLTLTVFTAFMLMIGLAWALVPAPPVNQYLGLPDTIFNEMTESACRYCHNQNPPAGVPVDPTYLPTRHHQLVSQTNPIKIPTGSDAPCVTPIDTTTFPNMTACTENVSTYACLSCHTFSVVNGVRTANVVRDCTKCHQQTAGSLTVHHKTTDAQKGLCAKCHGDFVSSAGCKTGMLYPTYPTDPSCATDTPAPAPTYIPSIVTPWPSDKPNGDNSGGGILMSTAGTYPGNCNYCHNTKLGDPGPITGTVPEPTGPFAPVDVYRNDITHHSTGFLTQNDKCIWCHNGTPPGSPTPDGQSIRTCQNCHDLKTIHNIQYDSTPATPVVPGSEPAGFGHVGAQSDCWGCHGNNGQTIGGAAGAEMTTGTVPGLYTTSFLTAKAGASTPITLAGNGFISINETYNEYYQSKLLLTARIGGASTTIAGGGTSDALTATVPSTLAPGNYKVQAMKDLIGVQKSNPLVIALKPAISITSATCSSGNVTIAGSGFHVYENGETTVKGTYNGSTLTGQVTSWTGSGIAAKFTVTTTSKGRTTTTAVCPTSVTVKNVFDSGTKAVTTSGGGKPRK